MNEEEILKECNELAKDKHHELGDCWDEEYSANAIKGLLDLYNQEKEKNKKLEEEKEAFAKGYTIARIEECDNYFLFNKVIDLMAGDIWKTDDYFTCKDIKMKEDCYADTLADGNACGGNCIKQYYFKKARGEEDDNRNKD